MTDDELIELKNRAATEFFRIPGVTAVGLGGRERAGRPTGEIVLKVFVALKRPSSELTPGERLPERFEGVGVDVDEMGEAVPLAAPPEQGSPRTTEQDLDKDDMRPVLKGGGRIEMALYSIGSGTLGCFLTDPGDPNKVYALTNHHVVVTERGVAPTANETRGGHPDNQDGPTKCCKHLIGTFVAGDTDPVRDAAVLRLDPGIQWVAEVLGIGIVTGADRVTVGAVAPLTYQVRKRGIRTGLTGGTVLSTNTTHDLDHPVTKAKVTVQNVLIIRPNRNAGVGADDPLYFADKGDSGSVIVNDQNKIVALLFAKAGGGPVFNGHAVPILDVLAQFQTVDHVALQVATATAAGQVQTVPGTPPTLLALRPAEVASAFGPADSFGPVGADLAASSAGRALRTLWTDHAAELLDLINTRRRVTLAWHRDGGPALTQSFLRLTTVPGARIPATTGGEAPLARLARIHAVLHANASPGLRSALDDALAALPDPAGRTYDEFLAALSD